MSASPPGDSMPRRISAIGAAPRASRMFSRVARYARASSRARGVSALVSVASATITHVASPVPATPVVTTARATPRITSASTPPRIRTVSWTRATVPTRANPHPPPPAPRPRAPRDQEPDPPQALAPRPPRVPRIVDGKVGRARDRGRFPARPPRVFLEYRHLPWKLLEVGEAVPRVGLPRRDR